MRFRVITEYEKLYYCFYEKFVNQIGYKPSKTEINDGIAAIISNLEWSEAEVLRAYARYVFSKKPAKDDTIFGLAERNTGISSKKLYKKFNIAKRHLYAPNNISLLVPNYYKLPPKDVREYHKLTKEDFDGSKYIVTALNKSQIYYMEQLKKHLSNGWYYLWTIPGIGDNGRQKILIAIDNWNKVNIW